MLNNLIYRFRTLITPKRQITLLFFSLMLSAVFAQEAVISSTIPARSNTIVDNTSISWQMGGLSSSTTEGFVAVSTHYEFVILDDIHSATHDRTLELFKISLNNNELTVSTAGEYLPAQLRLFSPAGVTIFVAQLTQENEKIVLPATLEEKMYLLNIKGKKGDKTLKLIRKEK